MAFYLERRAECFKDIHHFLKTHQINIDNRKRRRFQAKTCRGKPDIAALKPNFRQEGRKESSKPPNHHLVTENLHAQLLRVLFHLRWV